MPRIAKSLSHTKISKTRATDKVQTLFDGNQGLYLEITPAGAKIWRMKFMLDRKTIKMTLGRFPAMSLKSARIQCCSLRNMIDMGIDPRAVKKAEVEAEQQRKEQTFESLGMQWHTDKLSEWKAVTAKDILRRLKLDVFPALGNIPITEVTHQQIISLLKRIEARGAMETARRTKAYIGKIFSYAIQRGILKYNPVNDLVDVLRRSNKTHLATITREELPEFLRAIDSNRIRLFQTTQIAVHLMLLVFLRTSELIEAEWSEIDLENGVWVVPWYRMKMGKRMIAPDKTDHRIDLPHQAVSLLRRLHACTGDGKYLFPNIKKNGKCMSNATILNALRRMGYHKRMTGHGFRALAASSLEELGYRREVIDKQLAHRSGNKVQMAYCRWLISVQSLSKKERS